MKSRADQLHLDMTSDPAEVAGVRHAAEAFAQSHGFGDVAVGEIGLTLNEALANVIRHAYADQPGRPIEITLAMRGDALDVHVRDYGNGRTPDLSREKTELHTPGGLGLPCLKKMLDGVSFEKQPDGMLLRMTKHRG